MRSIKLVLIFLVLAPGWLVAESYYYPEQGLLSANRVRVVGAEAKVRYWVRMRRLRDWLFVVDEIEPLTPTPGYRLVDLDTRLIDFGDADRTWLFVRMLLPGSSCLDSEWDEFHKAGADGDTPGRIDIWFHSPECYVFSPLVPQAPVARSFPLRKGRSYELYLNGRLEQTIVVPAGD